MTPSSTAGVALALAGDVMTGRGIDQILAHPGDPQLYEGYVSSAQGYVTLAETVNGAIPRKVAGDYPWGDALPLFAGADLRIINLETSITTHPQPWPKGINYRMHPANIGVLTAAGIDCCVLANNHVLDWERPGLTETLRTLHTAGLQAVGAGTRRAEAEAPAALPVKGRGRVWVFAFGLGDSGIPVEWKADEQQSGVNRLADLSAETIAWVAAQCRAVKRAGDIAIASIHWGSNWGYDVPPAHRRFAHALVDDAGFDLVHGHSSHHPRPIEVYRERLILYGCGDLLNDYEGIGGYERYRGDLVLVYLPTLGADGRLNALRMSPLQLRRFRLHHAAPEDAAWLAERLTEVSAQYGSTVRYEQEGTLQLYWPNPVNRR